MSKNLGIGVLGDVPDDRSIMDQKMQKTYGTGTMELYTRNNEAVGVLGPNDMGVRSKKDMYMQRTYNPYYSEKYGSNKVYYKEAFQCPYAKTSDNPYNKYSYDIARLPLN